MGPKSNSFKRAAGSVRKANAAGFAKRQSRKAGTGADKTSMDVYEYSSGKNKRSAITLSLDKDEKLGMGEYLSIPWAIFHFFEEDSNHRSNEPGI